MLNTLKRKNPNKKSKKVGRGGQGGKTSGRGHKGQKSRAGHRIRPNFRDEIKRLPKRRGHGVHGNRNKDLMAKEKFFAVNLAILELKFSNDDKINPKSLLLHKIVEKKAGKLPKIKILAHGEISKKIHISGCSFSASAKEKIEKVGGSIK